MAKLTFKKTTSPTLDIAVTDHKGKGIWIVPMVGPNSPDPWGGTDGREHGLSPEHQKALLQWFKNNCPKLYKEVFDD